MDQDVANELIIKYIPILQDSFAKSYSKTMKQLSKEKEIKDMMPPDRITIMISILGTGSLVNFVDQLLFVTRDPNSVEFAFKQMAAIMKDMFSQVIDDINSKQNLAENAKKPELLN